jgi:hypothetical protein
VQQLADEEPDGFFRPPHFGHHGWLGVWLEVPVAWDEVGQIVAQAYRTIAPRALAARLTPDRHPVWDTAT